MAKARRHRAPSGEIPLFNKGTIVNLLGIPVLSSLVILIGFYFTQVQTNQQTVQQFSEEKTSREKLRDQFLQNAQETTKVLSQLSTNVAVQAEQNKEISSSLDKLSGQMEQFGNTLVTFGVNSTSKKK